MAVEETPELLEQSWQRWDHYLSFATRPSASSTEAKPVQGAYHYARAHAQDCRYVLTHRSDFQLQFLRAERFDVKTAVQRYLQHLDMLQHYFGPTALQQPLSFHHDLTRDESIALKKGTSFRRAIIGRGVRVVRRTTIPVMYVLLRSRRLGVLCGVCVLIVFQHLFTHSFTCLSSIYAYTNALATLRSLHLPSRRSHTTTRLGAVLILAGDIRQAYFLIFFHP